MGFDDNYTDADVSGLSMEMKFSMTQSAGGISSSNTFAQKFTIASSKAKTKLGISELGSFKSGAEAFEFKKTALGVFDDTHGNVLFRYDVGVAELDFSSQACVDDGSYLLADGCAGAKFQTGGALFADTADVPPVLKADFSPSEPSGFDCKPAAWTKVKPKTDQASQQAHAACDTAGAPDSLSMNACFEGYAEPAEEVTIEFEETGKEDDFDSILTDELTEV
jgi:hypothetical protein